jgi:Tfp pilus assembly protein PilN
MLKHLRNTGIFKSRGVIGLHYNANGGSNPIFSYVILVKKKGKIEIEQQAEIQCEFEKLPQIISTKYPVCLSIDGKGILHRQLEADSSKPAIQQAIPNANENDFVFEQFDGTSQIKYISFTRKEFVDDILGRLNDLKFEVIGLTISPFSCLGMYEIFPDLPVPFMAGNYELEIDRKTSEIKDFRKCENSTMLYKLGDNEITSSMVFPFFNAITYYTDQPVGSGYSRISDQKTEYISKRIFTIAGLGSLLLLFMSLLVNMFVFTSLSDEKQKLDLQVSGNTELISKLKQVKEELAWKEKFSGQSGNDRSRWVSFIADRIGASVPEEITLEKLEFHPVNSKIINNKEIDLKPGIIRIEGIAKSSLQVNDWALNLKKMTGIATVVIGSFSQLENQPFGIFTIEITLDNKEN